MCDNDVTCARAVVFLFLFKHQRQRAEATYMPVKSVQSVGDQAILDRCARDLLLPCYGI